MSEKVYSIESLSSIAHNLYHAIQSQEEGKKHKQTNERIKSWKSNNGHIRTQTHYVTIHFELKKDKADWMREKKTRQIAPIKSDRNAMRKPLM